MKNKKLILIILILVLILIIGIYIYIIKFKNIDKLTKEKNSKTIFSVNKITFFSSANADIEVSHNTSFNNLTQYTDIALFINNKNSSEELTAENTLKELYISNFKFNKMPSLGKPNLYYKNINDFATFKYDTNNLIENILNFNISNEDEIDYNLPILYNNCANPITISYINSNILDNYSISNATNSFYYDGSLLKTCNILLSSIECNLSFDIYLTNNLNKKFKTTVTLDIPLRNDNSSIYDGHIIDEKETNFIFEKCES